MYLLCLHGWGGSKDSFNELRAALEGSNLQILTPDLPGFGSEPEPETPCSTDDYVDWVINYIQKNIDGPYALLGHSHGGRIAIKLCSHLTQLHSKNSMFNVQRSTFNVQRMPQAQPQEIHCTAPTHLFLCAPAGIKHPKHIRRILSLTIAKIGNVLLSIPGLRSLKKVARKFLYKLLRVHDYEQASPVMQKTMIRVSKEDLSPILHSITIPTTLFWGEADTMTPLADGKLMESLIPKSTLHTYPNVQHRVHRDCAAEIASVIRTTLNEL